MKHIAHSLFQRQQLQEILKQTADVGASQSALSSHIDFHEDKLNACSKKFDTLQACVRRLIDEDIKGVTDVIRECKSNMPCTAPTDL
jgi:hypothetical protein